MQAKGLLSRRDLELVSVFWVIGLLMTLAYAKTLRSDPSATFRGVPAVVLLLVSAFAFIGATFYLVRHLIVRHRSRG